MTRGTPTLLALAVVTYALKSAGPLLLGGRQLPQAIDRLANLLPASLLAALVATSTFASGKSLSVDSRSVGLVCAAIVLAFRAPFVVVVVSAAATAAVSRQLGMA